MLTEKEKRRLAKNEKIMAVPKGKYILLYGVLAWGILAGLVFTITNTLINQKPFTEVIKRDLWINLGCFMIVGVFFSLLMRKGMQNYINKLKEKEPLS